MGVRGELKVIGGNTTGNGEGSGRGIEAVDSSFLVFLYFDPFHECVHDSCTLRFFNIAFNMFKNLNIQKCESERKV